MRKIEFEVQGPFLGKASVCGPILRALPQWFGIEAATNQYIEDIEGLPTLLAVVDGEVVGFVSLQEHSEYAAEVHVIAVRPELHHQGIGRALIDAAEQHLCRRGIEYLQVKTLSARHPDENYARTREFYTAVGFRPLEEFPELWGEANPCLQMIKHLDRGTAAKNRKRGD